MPGPYELYLIRHALAEERSDAWPDDAKRPLTGDGMARMRKAVRGLARIGLSVEVVLSSPLVRARQTAEIVASGLDPRPSLVNIDSLAPDGSFAAVLADLEKHARKIRIALVSALAISSLLAGAIAAAAQSSPAHATAGPVACCEG